MSQYDRTVVKRLVLFISAKKKCKILSFIYEHVVWSQGGKKLSMDFWETNLN